MIVREKTNNKRSDKVKQAQRIEFFHVGKEKKCSLSAFAHYLPRLLLSGVAEKMKQ